MCCICLTFLHCAFSNVSLNPLPQRMHSRIGCICFAFLHCVFSISRNGPIWKRKRIMCCLQQVLTGSRPSSAHISLWQSLSLLFNFYILTFPTHNIATTHIPKIFLGHCISTLFYLITNDLIHNAMTMKKKTSCYLTGPLGNLILKHLRSFVAN